MRRRSPRPDGTGNGSDAQQLRRRTRTLAPPRHLAGIIDDHRTARAGENSRERTTEPPPTPTEGTTADLRKTRTTHPGQTLSRARVALEKSILGQVTQVPRLAAAKAMSNHSLDSETKRKRAQRPQKHASRSEPRQEAPAQLARVVIEMRRDPADIMQQVRRISRSQVSQPQRADGMRRCQVHRQGQRVTLDTQTTSTPDNPANDSQSISTHFHVDLIPVDHDLAPDKRLAQGQAPRPTHPNEVYTLSRSVSTQKTLE